MRIPRQKTNATYAMGGVSGPRTPCSNAMRNEIWFQRGASHPSITAASAVQVNPMAIPIHGVWPSVPSLRARSDFVTPGDAASARSPRFPREGSSVVGRGSSAATVTVTSAGCTAAGCTWRASTGKANPCSRGDGIWTSGNGAGGVVFGTEGLGATAGGICCSGSTASARPSVGASGNSRCDVFMLRWSRTRDKWEKDKTVAANSSTNHCSAEIPLGAMERSPATISL